ncbi:MAG TPA: amidase [Gemmatimonadaceae bacterium]|nr:amidase [Gemmatimonadaceae bacterium]
MCESETGQPDDSREASPASNTDITRRDFGRWLGAAALGAPSSVEAAGRWLKAPAGAGPSQGAADICFTSAVELAAMIRARRISAREVMQAHLAQIERVNPSVNAIVTLVADRAMADAAAADEELARGSARGPLHGLPIAHKDLVATKGIRTTMGSPFFRDQVPDADAPIITLIRNAGALTLGKTNTPEFGAGSHTFNTIFGATRNPYDPTRSCGGSSGGAAVALACGMVPIADGSDTGGSLRNPAAFCNVVGFRPSPGRVSVGRGTWSPLSTSGPMARSVADVALFLSVLATPDTRSPMALMDDPARFAGRLDRDFRGTRVAWYTGLGGIPFEPEIRRVIGENRRSFESLGCVVEEAEPDFTGVDEAFATLRHLSYHSGYAAMARERPEWIKDTIHWEIREAERQTSADVARALALQSRLYAQVQDFFTRYDYFVLPVTQVEPFDVTIAWPTSVAGVPMETYIDWMRSCWYVTFMANPAISVPAGFTRGGLPVGLQIVGRHRDDWSVLQLAHAFERATGHGLRRPPLVRG